MHMSGSMIELHISLKTVFEYNVIRKTTCQLCSRVYRRRLPHQARLIRHLQHHIRKTCSKPNPASFECESADEQARDNPSSNPTKILKPNKDKDHEQVRGNPSHSEIQE